MPQALPRKTALAFGIKQLDNKFQYVEQRKPASVGGAMKSPLNMNLTKEWDCMKRVICTLLVLCMLFSLTGCSEIIGSAYFLFLVMTSDDSADKDEVFEFVCERESELLKAIEDGDFSAFENKGFIKDIDADEAVVDFSCGGAGVGSGTSYVGFYYTADNDMTAVWCAPSSADSLTPLENGFEWKEPNGDNRYYTEHICGNFYYYEASF